MNAGEWDWTWDESLYAGSAEHYAVGRMAKSDLRALLRDAAADDLFSERRREIEAVIWH
ncbi:hypothetical protein [Kribbella pittospori]|uniref:hypothetical protein n=1 Tax=Kribbella pittospori TaxID=722689 RepID=UPI0013F429B9|nr:hypothetical protein [Kribbella pittospori]